MEVVDKKSVSGDAQKHVNINNSNKWMERKCEHPLNAMDDKRNEQFSDKW